MTRLIWLFVLFTLLPIHANTDIPKPLEPWVNWVLEDSPEYQCPFFYNNHQQKHCSWPSQLNLTLDKQQGHFDSYWQVYNDSYLNLPGDNNFWPQNIRVNNKPAIVIKHNNSPAIKLSAGQYHIQGEFFWSNIPDSLSIPEQTGLISVRVLGKDIPSPTIKNNQLWLRASDTGNTKPTSTPNQLDLQVFRKVIDDIPLRLVTHLTLQVSGKQREIKLPYTLLQGFIPINLNSPLAARLEKDGSLLVQLRPGHWQIELTARHPEQLTDISLAINNQDWPAYEIWSFAAQTYQRLVEVSQVIAIDPSQSNVPKQWQQLPAFLVNQGDKMHFNVIKRGDPEPNPNDLSITRHLWLDFAGTGYTIQDTISGKITHNWRLDSLPATQLGHVNLNGQTQLITRLPDSKTDGVELRKGQLQLTADSRLTHSISEISAVGWQEKFNHVNAFLHLPPGWHLLAVSGVDNVPNSWINRWTLLDLFLVLIAALAVSRLWSHVWGLFALISLALIWHEAGAPRLIWLNILAAISLIKVLPQGNVLNLIKFYRSSCWLVLLFISIPFLIQQARTGLYPQLERPWQSISTSASQNLESVAIMDKLMEEEKSMQGSYARKRNVIPSASYAQTPAPDFKRIDPNANLQTGPGLPQWQWTEIPLSWNGSVDSQQQIKLWYLTPTSSMLLNFLRIILVVIFSLLMLGLINKRLAFKLPHSTLSLGLLICLLLPITPVRADYPSPELLNELKQRLLKAPDCLPNCAQIAAMHIVITDTILQLDLQVHAQKTVAIPLPTEQDNWLPNEITVNKVSAHAIIRDNQGVLWLSLEPGIHKVTLKGRPPQQNSFTLPLPLKPQHITHNIQQWSLEGLKPNGTAENNLLFTRLQTETEKKNTLSTLSSNTLPPFIQIERTLQLGLDWHIATRINRLSHEPVAITLKVPLIKDELITSSQIRSENGYALIHMSANQQSIEWQSLLEKSTQINLVAPATDQWSEVWRADISPMWHIQSTGISAVHHQNQAGNWLPEWRPWPNEGITLKITRPEAILGQTLTIDKSSLQITSGKRAKESQLDLDLRSSKGTQHTITLPENAILQSVSLNAVTQAIRQQGQSVTLPIEPGTQHYQLNWHEISEQSSILTTSAVNLGSTSVNTHLSILLGQDRWVLLTMGPQFGPAVLFWGLVFVLAILAFALGKAQLTPLKHWHWFLLLIGLSQVPIAAALVVVAWLIALDLRKKQVNDNAHSFNLIQIFLVLMTLGSLAILFIAVEQGLLGSPDMQIVGNQSTAEHLKWYQDRSNALLPTATVVSIPLLSYRIMMLVWSLWLAISLLNWLKWGWQCFSAHGLWKKPAPKVKPMPENIPEQK
ncbi:MAG: hypothetical protein K9L22_07755 [Methylococcaceae bacterium]|nr:hypothetical protein [Methylococcaceae bacterium]